jgi:hypothetical protein
MSDEPNVKKDHGFVIKLMLILSISIFVAIGGYSVYKIILQKSNIEDKKIAETLKPTENAVKTSENNSANQITIPPTEGIVTISETPSAKPANMANSPTPAKSPIPSPTIKPTNSPIPTFSPTVKPTLSLSPTPKESLPVSGNSFPTLLLISLGIFFILPIILLK